MSIMRVTFIIRHFAGIFFLLVFQSIVVYAHAADKETPQNDNAGSAQAKVVINLKDYNLHDTSVLAKNDILAYYGHPNSKGMGIVGRLPKDKLLERLNAQAEEYKTVSGGRGIVKALYLIYGTVWPEGEIGIIGKDRLKEYITFAGENDLLVFLDHQIGKYDPIDSLKKMLPYLKEYPNVHLALDPEWRTHTPNDDIGSVTADEINKAQEVMQQYMIDNKVDGERLLVIHQFKEKMIKKRAEVKSDFEKVRLVLCMDGHGTPKEKRETYLFNSLATNIPVKAFKLFYNEKGNTGIDVPLLTPSQVYGLNPRPLIIMYQ